jgi:hypothetical protein
MPRYNKQQDFENGLAQLEPFFQSHGFSMFRSEPYRDNEGIYYSVRFSRSPRSVALTHLYSVGPVIYSIGESSVEHSFYTEALGVSCAAQFPSFGDDSTSGYPALLHDLKTVLSPFFTSPDADFIAIATRYMEQQRQQYEHDTRDLNYRSTQEPRLKARARDLFFRGHYHEVVQLESQIRHPELLTNSERQLFALARKRQ